MQGQPQQFQQQVPQQYRQQGVPVQGQALRGSGHQPQVMRQGAPVQGQVLRKSGHQPQVIRQQPQMVRQGVPQPQVIRQQPQMVRQGVPNNLRNTHANGDERRLDEYSARILAKKVFQKYDANHSGYMNSLEAGQLVSDLYGSLNVNHTPNQNEGFEFMVANDVNYDNQISLEDFQDIFAKNLSAGMGGFRLFADDNTYHTGTITQGVVQPVRTQGQRLVHATNTQAPTVGYPQGRVVQNQQQRVVQAQPQGRFVQAPARGQYNAAPAQGQQQFVRR